jgi:REP element-mobilizing transposase RayT
MLFSDGGCPRQKLAIKKRMVKRAKQLEFQTSAFLKPKDSFGGATLRGNPRSAKPLDSKLPIHLTLRAKKSVLRLPKTFKTVEKLIDSIAKKYGVKIFKRANVGNHLHLVIQVNPWMWARFIRELTGRIAQIIKDMGIALDEGFWLYRPHTRIVRGWKKAFQIALDYIRLNQLEADGHIKRKETKTLHDLRAIFDG